MKRKRIAYNRRSRKEIKKIVNDLGYKLIDEYYKKRDNKHRRVIISDNFGYKYNMNLDSLIKGHLSKVNKHNEFSLRNISLWLILNNKNFRLCRNNVYKATGRKLLFQCNKCKEKFYKSWASITQGEGCLYCVGRRVGKSNSLYYLRKDLVKEWSLKNRKSPKDFTVGSHKIAWWICKNCNKDWKCEIYRRTNKKSYLCPNCKISLGEKVIMNWLDKNNIKYTFQKRFEKCRSKKPLPIDFHIPKFNICIEYNGKQHYEEIGYFGGKRGLENRKIVDRKKKNYCKRNKIKLLIIPYLRFNDIGKILEKTFL